MKRNRPRRAKPKRREHHVSPESGSAGAFAEVVIERIVPGGLGLGHADGATFFVALAAPGDYLRVRVERTQGRVVFASIAEILAPSPARVIPPCPYFGRCGGCDFQQLDYPAQLAAKRDMIRDALRRIGRVEWPDEIRLVPAPAAWRYRARAEWQYDGAGKTLGYYERGTHRVCDVVECPVLTPELQKTLTGERERLHAGLLASGGGEVEAVAGDDGVSLLRTPEEHAPPSSAPAVVTRVIRGEHYRFAAGGFFQINQQLLPTLVEEALADLRGGGVALDLYCGVGLFTLPLARSFARVIGVEGHAGAVSFARRNLEDANLLTNAEVVNARVGPWLAEMASHLPPVDLILLDPPRSGAEPQTVAAMGDINPRRIVYVSCDPSTLARDLRLLMADGRYAIESIVGLDLFPQTHHVETVVRLSRRERAIVDPPQSEVAAAA